jgi:hypothetical protein
MLHVSWGKGLQAQALAPAEVPDGTSESQEEWGGAGEV